MKIRSPPHPTSAQMWAQLRTFQNLKNENCKTIIKFRVYPSFNLNSRKEWSTKTILCPFSCNWLIPMNDMHFHSAWYFLNLLSHGLILTYPNDWPTRDLAQIKYLPRFPLNYKCIFFFFTKLESVRNEIYSKIPVRLYFKK